MPAVTTTYADALAALRAECGEPTAAPFCEVRLNGYLSAQRRWQCTPTGSVWLVYTERSGCVVLLSEERGRPYDGVAMWTLAGTPTPDAPLTPLADAVRDAGAWLRGRG